MSSTSASAHITKDSLLMPTIQAWKIFLEDQANSPHTVKAFVHDLQLLASFIPPDRSLGNIATTDLNNFLEWLQTGRGVACSPKTLARRITSIKAFFRWLNKNGKLTIDPAEKVIQKSVISPLPTILTDEEVELAFITANQRRHTSQPDTRHYALFFLLIHSGIKKSECLGLDINHIDLDTPTGPVLFVRYSSPQHRFKERKIHLPIDWISIFKDYSKQYRITRQLFPWSQRRLEYLLEDISKESGIEKHISFDMCRWTCAVRDWNNGMDRDQIRQKLGVSNVQWREISMKLRKLTMDDLNRLDE